MARDSLKPPKNLFAMHHHKIIDPADCSPRSPPPPDFRLLVYNSHAPYVVDCALCLKDQGWLWVKPGPEDKHAFTDKCLHLTVHADLSFPGLRGFQRMHSEKVSLPSKNQSALHVFKSWKKVQSQTPTPTPKRQLAFTFNQNNSEKW